MVGPVVGEDTRLELRGVGGLGEVEGGAGHDPGLSFVWLFVRSAPLVFLFLFLVLSSEGSEALLAESIEVLTSLGLAEGEDFGGREEEGVFGVGGEVCPS